MVNILITGASGTLGKELLKLLPSALAPAHNEMPIENREKVQRYLQKQKPIDIVIHLAAMTKILACEQDKNDAWAVNVEGTRNIMELCYEQNRDIYAIYASTPCIFSGDDDCYYEDSIPNPKNFYGLTKLLGEQITSQTMNYALIFRANFVGYRRYPYERAFTDRFGTYLFTHQVAKAIIEVMDERLVGLVHIVGDRKLSMHDLAKICPDSDDVKPMTISDYNGIGKLTMNMTMDTKRWHKYSILD